MAVVPSRFDSSRLPGKALLPLAGEPMLKRVLERIQRSRSLEEVVVATTTLPSDDPIVRLASDEGARVFRGDPDDVLGRIDRAAREARAEVVVEVMGDSPLVHADLLDATVDLYAGGDYDYVAGYTETVRLPGHRDRRPFPVGLTAQVFAAEVLARCAREKHDPYSREHSTSSIYRDPETFRLGYLEARDGWSEACRPDLFLAVNLPEQYRLVNGVFEACLPEDGDFGVCAAIAAADALLADQGSGP
ncbi:MAG TPA: NTP transferase domain-containing protein [Thermoanaerobaculia bacterium]|nr:NTP transferase domain-containing protein [Thermoanaerobaculia bacterium]